MKSPPLPQTVSQKQLAEILGITVQRVGQLVAAGAIFKADSKSFDLKSSVQAFVKYAGTKRSNQWDTGATGGDGDGYEEHRARLTGAKADIAEIQAETMKGNFHEAGAVEAVWSDMLMNARSRLLAIPTRTAPLVRKETELPVIQDILETAVHQALLELSEYDPSRITSQYISAHRRDVEATIQADS